MWSLHHFPSVVQTATPIFSLLKRCEAHSLSFDGLQRKLELLSLTANSGVCRHSTCCCSSRRGQDFRLPAFCVFPMTLHGLRFFAVSYPVFKVFDERLDFRTNPKIRIPSSPQRPAQPWKANLRKDANDLQLEQLQRLETSVKLKSSGS